MAPETRWSQYTTLVSGNQTIRQVVVVDVGTVLPEGSRRLGAPHTDEHGMRVCTRCSGDLQLYFDAKASLCRSLQDQLRHRYILHR